MSLNRGEVNPLSVLGLRKLDFIPEHFFVLTLENKFYDIKSIEYWINYNLNSRYAIKQTVVINESRKIVNATKIGLEDPKEITMLSLGCPDLYKK